MGNVKVEPATLVAGEHYRINGGNDNMGPGIHTFYPALYIRDERLREGDFHVFAAHNEFGFQRLKASLGDLVTEKRTDGENGILICKNRQLQTVTLMSPLGELPKMTREFIDEAYKLIRENGPHVSTLRRDAMELAGVWGRGSHDMAKLKIMIDYQKNGAPNMPA